MAASLVAAQNLVDLLTGAYGPVGRAVLVQNPTGQMIVTRSGFNILKSVFSEIDSPHLKIIMNSVEKLHDAYGDGVKSFVFMVTEMLRSCVNLDGPYKVASELGGLQSRLSQLSVDNVGLFQQNALDNLELVYCLYSKIINTFLSSRFPYPVSSVLGPLLHKWVTMMPCKSPDEAAEGLSALYQDFSNLCQYENGSSRSVSESCIKNGFILNRRPINLSKSGRRKVIVLTLHDSDSECGKFDALDIKCEVDRLLVELKQNRKAYNEITPVGIILITSVILSDLTLFNLGRNDVAVVHGAAIDEVNFISSLLSRRSRAKCAVQSVDIVDVTFQQNRDYVTLNFPEINQLLICGPTKELCSEYAQTCHRALKLVTINNQTAFRNIVVEGGDFERSLHRHLTSKLDHRKMPRFVNRAELLAWHKAKQADSVKLASESSDIYKLIGEAFTGLDQDVMEAVLQGMLAVPPCLPRTESTEPVGLRVGVLMHALGAVITLVKVDAVLYTKRPTVKT